MAFLLTLALSYVPSFLFAMIVFWLDRFEKEPKRLLVAVFAWGSIVAVIGAVVWSLVFQLSLFLLTGSEMVAEIGGTTLIAPVVEESIKGLAVLIVFLVYRREFDSVLDGIVYAAITALGFAATENVLYLYFSGYQEGGMGGLLGLFFLRVVLGGWNHPVFTAFTGMGLAISRLSPNRVLRKTAPFAGLVLAIFAHALHNTLVVLLSDAAGLAGFAAVVLVDWIGWALTLSVIIWAIVRERSWLVTHLREEVERGVISANQYKVACSSWAQTRARLRALGSGRYGSTRHFFQLCAELAQKKHQHASFGDERGNSAIIEGLRAELARLAPQVAV